MLLDAPPTYRVPPGVALLLPIVTYPVEFPLTTRVSVRQVMAQLLVNANGWLPPKAQACLLLSSVAAAAVPVSDVVLNWLCMAVFP